MLLRSLSLIIFSLAMMLGSVSVANAQETSGEVCRCVFSIEGGTQENVTRSDGLVEADITKMRCDTVAFDFQFGDTNFTQKYRDYILENFLLEGNYSSEEEKFTSAILNQGAVNNGNFSSCAPFPGATPTIVAGNRQLLPSPTKVGQSLLLDTSKENCGVENFNKSAWIGYSVLLADDVTVNTRYYSVNVTTCQVTGVSEIGSKLDRASILAEQEFSLPSPANLQKLRGGGNFQTTIGLLLKVLMEVVGSIALAMFVYGGILIMTAAGNSERTQKGTKVLVWAGLGIMVILSSYALVDFIFSAF